MEKHTKKTEVKTEEKAPKKKGKKVLIIVLCVLLGLIIAFVGSFFALRYMGFRGFHKNDTHIDNSNVKIEDESYITYKGQKYRLNNNIINILIMGVDKRDINDNSERGINGQADCIFLAAVDTEKKTYTIIPISRETMVDIETYTEAGNFSGIKKEQICLAYAYGGTPKESSENVLKAVKRMFYGINISSYVTVDLDGMIEFSSMVGGVTLTSIETLDDKFYEGEEYTLSGRSALNYIRARGKDIDANNRRMQRQKQFLSALLSKAGNQVLDDFTKLSDYYNAMQPYTFTNVDLAKLTYFASTCLSRDIGSKMVYKSIEGTMSESKYNEFNINEDQLLDLVVETFYIKA